ncbi:NAD(P)-dependent oxidoreductase [Haloferax mediterranei ATCC 33500]|uniref:NAD(P)-dependent oxidoreductase n=1 Tax=Haloferax mediterranei (strain ATCC 33500 / DSM 1411 / JCM 8866 / NBRC 14739 / NCIMB 2177 / R-4) TaxID=523841 RepID=I3R0U3_HALMT|nr:NAD(P)-dependent oxidoreductase [Haloferax mediterranei]AFK17853.1 UDP-glucose 4-epimerase [Haloferax mediterranei ATCC 33500]EMA02874.1 UDP-glucose 4-epimerase [Haloferax mediterranei ATCC 33500]MDX5987941.1 NAD(P)-dependent oxidoreductase [Haloferax mediterranei ATCC 33500]QCQ74411.1 NAD(P)-dependent oxidoreductase [Haloferax mediterranei ATCC 33500]
METLVVTGALGRSGRWITDRLAEEYEVVAVDLDHPGFEVDARENVDFRAADLMEMGEVADLVADIDPDAVVHWAAIPSPTRHAGSRVFETNVQSTYNVLVAAARADSRIVWASSESAYGFAFAEEKRLPDVLPITEDHPLRPEDPYGTAKVAGEEVSKMVARKYDVSSCAIRPSWIQYPGEYNCRDIAVSGDFEAGAGNFWTYVDVRDVAELVATALENPVSGHEAVHAAAADTYLGRPTAGAAEKYWGELPDDCSLDGEESALSTAKAGDLFNWEPSYSWRDAVDETVSEPTLWE